ncbi:hypothetical protein GPECTOR_57g460 [Gonium pectorale]|uniref:Uncharacterized protein n=1 Tax=Gonium pectorale TaxID=33097 RepID=A0A150G753_GONPE|nr:hypothetical protein GPECTOR_57g460 [Gonium pectorale]|eukprot:KXZ45170.1 hypothetical protein GPECTOR_57g460 [Gonium pectorale]
MHQQLQQAAEPAPSPAFEPLEDPDGDCPLADLLRRWQGGEQVASAFGEPGSVAKERGLGTPLGLGFDAAQEQLEGDAKWLTGILTSDVPSSLYY